MQLLCFLKDIIWKKCDINANSSEYFRTLGFSIIVSSEANNRSDMRLTKKAGNARNNLSPGYLPGPDPLIKTCE